ncbi:LacI family transcriptional regulator [Streptomyces sp. A7024]|uniref:LacI family transcriptional regulator n=1 Tax=Streptomyces coryli TaxID=1128680 RepID=A0A6G4U1K1_9ACTN|nr:LacI family DNA-binding transcriptional regulator [Streptomyces coryli]NGN65258.1 LacI family transcriptional regulator [Streptomyces coryli]
MTDRTLRPPAPTSADVARRAGVSRATVSYALNDNTTARVSEATRARVRAAAEELGYVPNFAARTLRAGSNRTVLLPTPDIPVGPLFSRFLIELQRGLVRRGYAVVQYGAGDRAPGGVEQARAWAELRPAAVFGANGLSDEAVRVLRGAGVRALVAVASAPVPGLHTLVLDHSRVGAAAVAHLAQRGCRRIGVVVPAEPELAVFAGPRLRGAREAAAAGGAHAEPVDLAYTEESAAELAGRWRELGLDGVFAYNDEYAMLLQRALQDAGLEVPADVAVIGADDLLLGRLLRPRLSTVRIELPGGAPLSEAIDRLVRGPGEEPEVVGEVAVEVEWRESTGRG